MRHYFDFEKRYINAVETKNIPELAYFAQFGDESHCIQNACRYEASIACGFTESFTVNEHGWCTNGTLTDIETIPVIEGREQAYIHLSKLPNERWVAESNAYFGNSGYGGLPSVFSKSYHTREEAIINQIERINHFIKKESSRPNTHLLQTKQFMQNYKIQQMTLF